MADQNDKMDKLVSLCKRRGFVFPTAEQYGGLQGFWDWGPLGVELKNNIKRAWWKRFVQERRDVVGLDSAIITNPTVWEKSGHVEGFSDDLVECRICHLRFKQDDKNTIDNHLVDEVVNKFEEKKRIQKILEEAKERLQKSGSYTERVSSTEAINKLAETFFSNNKDQALLNEVSKFLNDPVEINKVFTKSRKFNTMFHTSIGPIENTGSSAFLRPETAQNIFVNYENVLQMSRMKLPFGIAQIGKAFRNEITPGNFIFRTREFEQMELEFFIESKDDDKWFKYWVAESETWFIEHGINKEHLHQHEQKKDELAHYAKATIDIEYNWPFDKGWSELMGIANRTDFDLKAHGGKDPVPYVIEPSFGVERAALAFLLDAFDEVEGGRTTTTASNKESEVVLRLHKSLAPIKAAILPLSKKEPLQKVADEIFDTLKGSFRCDYDEVSSIGRRYRRQDEIGTPYCVTIDFDSLEDKAVTVRDRDTMQQERIPITELKTYLTDHLNAE